MQKNIQLNIRGKVQGVWFRDSTRRKALELGLAGYVRNEPDGSVRVEAEGAADALEALTDWCRQGPPRAEVTSLEKEEGEWVGYDGFEIRR